jgi:hypothetical protein
VTADQFRNHDYLPGQWAKELRTNGILQLVLELMEENHPARMVLHADNNGDMSPTRAAIELGVTRGYSKFGDTLKLLALRKFTGRSMPEPTYAPEPVEEIKK